MVPLESHVGIRKSETADHELHERRYLLRIAKAKLADRLINLWVGRVVRQRKSVGLFVEAEMLDAH